MSIQLNQTVRAIAFFAFLAAPGAQAAESATPIRPGDSGLQGTSLKPYKNAWKVVYAFPGKDPFLVGTWTDELEAVEVEGRHLLKRSQVANYAKYHIVTTYVNVFDPKTMSPVFTDYKRSDTGEWAHRDFEGDTVHYDRAPSSTAQAEKGDLKLAESIFDYNGGLYGVLLAALPLKEGWSATFPTLSEDRDELDRITITVGKEELVEAGPGKQVLAWPVDTEGNYANKSHSTFWISKDAPYVIKLVATIPEGKWVTVTMTMI